MSEFAVKWSQQFTNAEELRSVSAEIRQKKEELSRVRSGLSSCLSLSSYYGVNEKIKAAMESLENQYWLGRTLGERLEDIVKTYMRTESAVCDKAGAQFSGKESAQEEKDTSKLDWKEIRKLLWKLVGPAGGVGALISGVSVFWEDGFSLKNCFSAGKGAIKFLGNIAAEAVSGSPKWAKALFGDWRKGGLLDDLIEGGYLAVNSGAKAGWKDVFWASMNKEFDGLKFQTGKTSHNIKAGVKWGGYALSAIVSLIGNYDEFGGNSGAFSNARFWEESALETAIDIGVGMLAGAGAAALLGASAPAVAVGAAGVAAVWAVDWATKKITGLFGEEKRFTEWASDTILNTAEGVVNKGKEFVKWAGKGISRLWNG